MFSEHELPAYFERTVRPETGQPFGVTPLVWSHAEMINTLLDLAEKPANKKVLKARFAGWLDTSAWGASFRPSSFWFQ